MTDEELIERLAAVLDDTATGLYMGQNRPGWGRVIAGILLPEVKRYAGKQLRAAADRVGGFYESQGSEGMRAAYAHAAFLVRDSSAALAGRPDPQPGQGSTGATT